MRRTDQTKRNRRGFTLLEMMMVVVLIGILAGVSVVALGGAAERARISTTKTVMKTIKNALETYNGQYGTYPDQLSVLWTIKPPLVEKTAAMDAWKRNFLYRYPSTTSNDLERPYDLQSMGKSGQAGNEDNINVWTMDDNPGTNTGRPN